MTTRLPLRLFASALLAALAGCAGHGPTTTSISCDRACLKGQIDNYLAALLAHDPGRLHLAANARFTEDTTEKKLGDSPLWHDATALRPFRQDYLDVRTGTAAAHVALEESGNPVLLALRLKVVGGKLAEIETITVHNQLEGMLFAPENLKAPSAAMNYVPTAAERNTRDDMVAIASGYPSGLKIGSFPKAGAKIAANAYRFENGMRMAGPGCTFQPPSCENMLQQRIPTLSGIVWRLVAVDEEMGLVLFRLDFGPGSLMGANAKTHTLHAWEAFKVYGGEIHAAEAVMRGMPAGTPSGWDP
ncbi:MAG: hypothetical protein WDO12_00565 [Pseudomonadota bacterium]